MTRADQQNLERLVGRIEAQLEALIASMEKVDAKLDAADDWRHQVKDRLEKMEAHGRNMTEVANAFDALQQSIREGTIRAKAYSKGVLIGIGIAAGGAGATVATFIKWAYSALTGA